MLGQKIRYSKRKKKNLFILLINIKNTFGSIPQDAIIAAMEASGAGTKMVNLMRKIDEGSRTQLLTKRGQSDLIDIRTGVKQGDPMSGTRFNIGMNPIFDVIQDGRRAIHCLGYADDVVVMEDTIEDLERTLQEIVDFTTKIGLTINAAKCRTIHLTGKSRCADTQFFQNGTPIPVLREFEPAKYLGKPFGFHILEDEEEIETIIEKGKNILQSELAPWQKLDALKSFYKSCTRPAFESY